MGDPENNGQTICEVDVVVQDNGKQYIDDNTVEARGPVMLLEN